MTRRVWKCLPLIIAVCLAPIDGIAQVSPDGPTDTIRIVPQGGDRLEINELRGQIRVLRDDVPPEVTLAERMMQQGMYSEARELLTSLWQRDPDNQSISGALKRAINGLKDYSGLKAVLIAELKRSPGDPQLMSELADAQFLLGEREAAEKTIEDLIAADPQDAERYRFAARSYSNNGRYIDGIMMFRRGREILGDSLVFAEELGRMFEARREYAAAVDEHFRWLAARPESRTIAQNRITNLIKVPGALSQITEALQRIVRAYPQNEYAHSLYGDLLFESGSLDSAFIHFRRADELSGQPGEYQAHAIDRCIEKRDFETARAQAIAFRKLYPAHPRTSQVLFAQARAELGLGRPAVAIGMLKDLATQFPEGEERARVDFEIGELYLEHAVEPDSARSYFNKVAARQGRDQLRAKALLRLGDIEVRHASLATADSIYREALTATPRAEDREEVAFRRAQILLFQGEYDRCLEALKSLAKDFPRGLYVNDALELSVVLGESKDQMNWSLDRYAGGLYALRRGLADSALVLFAQLAADSANKIADEALFQIAGINSGRRRYEQAAEEYRSMISRFPESFLVPRAWAEIGALYEGPLADPHQAREAYQTILTDHKDSPLVENVRLRLQRLTIPQ
ncbi:MAG: tetratricopeptide repeat protein [Candidatus Zixiibacteriota bacterium]